MTFILANWRVLLLAVLVASSAMFFKFWRNEVADFTAYRIEVAALGKAAEAEKKRIEAEHAKTTKEIKDAIPKKLAAARSGAVAAYLARMPAQPGGGSVSCPAVSAGGTDAAGEERMVASTGFVQDCAHDAAMIGSWQDWARGVGFPVR